MKRCKNPKCGCLFNPNPDRPSDFCWWCDKEALAKARLEEKVAKINLKEPELARN